MNNNVMRVQRREKRKKKPDKQTLYAVRTIKRKANKKQKNKVITNERG